MRFCIKHYVKCEYLRLFHLQILGNRCQRHGSTDITLTVSVTWTPGADPGGGAPGANRPIPPHPNTQPQAPEERDRRREKEREKEEIRSSGGWNPVETVIIYSYLMLLGGSICQQHLFVILSLESYIQPYVHTPSKWRLKYVHFCVYLTS